MEDAVTAAISSGDFVRLRNSSRNRTDIVEILSAAGDTLTCRPYVPMTSDFIRKYSLQPIISSLFPVASQTNIVELVGTFRVISVARNDVEDVVFVIPSQELESGLVHLTGSSNLYFVRFSVSEDDTICNFVSSLYFRIYFIEPFSILLFGALNMLAQQIKKTMYHVPSAQEPKKNFRMYFPSEAFNYLCLKIDAPSTVIANLRRRQRIIKYYDTLKSESGTRVNNITYLRIVTHPALMSLRNVLGAGIGIGAAGGRPTKSRPLQYCTIGSLLSSIECPTDIAPELVITPLTKTNVDGIDFVYNYENRSLMCFLRFSKIPIVTADVATSRISVAFVTAESVGAFVGACFHYDEEMYEVVAIYETLCRCQLLADDDRRIDLPIELVNKLVNLFGS
jgi:hypothetical protein